MDNLCDINGNSRPWLCSMQDRSGVLRVELQMERAAPIGFIDVGGFVHMVVCHGVFTHLFSLILIF